eukprot:jgi/Chrzof1/2103/Cz11g02250.t1
MDLIYRLAAKGLIHCDFNEFNLLIDEDDELTLIDFPQMVSISHANAKELFDRDVECIIRFFSKKVGYMPQRDSSLPYIRPSFEAAVAEAVAAGGCGLDVELAASGFQKQHQQDLEEFTATTARDADSDGDHEDEDEDDDDVVSGSNHSSQHELDSEDGSAGDDEEREGIDHDNADGDQAEDITSHDADCQQVSGTNLQSLARKERDSQQRWHDSTQQQTANGHKHAVQQHLQEQQQDSQHTISSSSSHCAVPPPTHTSTSTQPDGLKAVAVAVSQLHMQPGVDSQHVQDATASAAAAGSGGISDGDEDGSSSSSSSAGDAATATWAPSVTPSVDVSYRAHEVQQRLVQQRKKAGRKDVFVKASRNVSKARGKKAKKAAAAAADW